MDCRETLGVNETFLELLKSCFRSKTKAYLLVDDDGIRREEGFIVKVENGVPQEYIEMDSGIKIPVKKILAVDGTFLPEFGECRFLDQKFRPHPVTFVTFDCSLERRSSLLN